MQPTLRSIACALGVSAVLAASASAQLLFEPPQHYQDERLGLTAAVGDINEDGIPDAALIVGPNVARLQLLIGAGDGTFSEASELVVNSFTPRVALQDINGDGHLDLGMQAQNNENFGFEVRLGNGNGSFGSPVVSVDPGPVVNHVAFGDFNGDGVLDMASPNAGTLPSTAFPADLDLLLGNGDGSFSLILTKPLPPWTSNGVTGIEVGDITGDRVLDLAVLLESGDVYVYRGFGNGGFSAPDVIPVAAFGGDLGLADLNSDGLLDLIVADSQANQIATRLGGPNGTFAAPTFEPLSDSPNELALGDMDGDSHVDIAVTGANSGDIATLRGLGDGSFGPAVNISGFHQPRAPSLADLDGDGRLDIVVANRSLLIDPMESSALASSLNHTYAPGAPFLDLGFSLAGTSGYPILLADGTLQTSDPYAFTIANGPSGGSAGVVLGLLPLLAPFKGGTYVPFPDVQLAGLALDASGSLTLAGNWPALPSGFQFYMQSWFIDPGAVAGWSSTSGLAVTLP